MGIFSSCSVCGSDWCSGAECCRISPDNLRRLAKLVTSNVTSQALTQLADYFESKPKLLDEAMKEVIKSHGN